MARQKAKLRLRPTDGMLEDVTIALPVSWAAGLRERADKLGLSIESVVVQLCGHAASELGQLHKAVDGPRIALAMTHRASCCAMGCFGHSRVRRLGLAFQFAFFCTVRSLMPPMLSMAARNRHRRNRWS